MGVATELLTKECSQENRIRVREIVKFGNESENSRIEGPLIQFTGT